VRRPQVDLIEETYIAADRALVAARVHDPDFVRTLWPDLDLKVLADRGQEGLRWTATGALVGSVEVWLEAVGDGVVVHTYLRCDPTEADGRTARTVRPRQASREVRRRAVHAKQVLWSVKDELTAGRRPGDPAVNAPAPAAHQAGSVAWPG